VAGGHVPPGRARGGEDIQAPRPGHARLATAIGALLPAAALAGSPFVRETSHEAVLLTLGIAGFAALCLGLAARWSAALACGIALLGGEQAVRLAFGPDAVDSWTPLYAAGLLFAAELAWWSIEPRIPAWSQPDAGLRRLGFVVVTCGGGAALSALVVVAADAPLGGGVAVEVLGVVAATAALAVVAAVARARVG
jgi:hypothetical protein